MNIFRRRPIPPIEHLPGEVEAEHDAFLRIANDPELEGLGQKGYKLGRNRTSDFNTLEQVPQHVHREFVAPEDMQRQLRALKFGTLALAAAVAIVALAETPSTNKSAPPPISEISQINPNHAQHPDITTSFIHADRTT